MNKIIKFTAKDKYSYELCIPPFPASQAIPKWHKDMTPYQVSPDNPDGKKFILENRISNATFKKCVPMLDALTSGYIIPLWSDVQIKQTITGPRITWRSSLEVFEQHGENSQYVENPPGYTNSVFKFMNKWIPHTPNGYSVLVIPPVGYRNLPFRAIEAVLDSDKANLEPLFPMWIKEGFEGVVEKGTPLVQVIPFKRTSWTAEFDYYADGEHKLLEDKTFNSTLVNHYIKNFWSKKSYR
jgi:hypothetical protein